MKEISVAGWREAEEAIEKILTKTPGVAITVRIKSKLAYVVKEVIK